MANDDAATSSGSIHCSSNTTTLPGNSLKCFGRDSFAELIHLMRAKKPYTFSLKSTTHSPITAALNGPHYSKPTMDPGHIRSPLPKSANAPETVAEFLRKQELAASPTNLLQDLESANSCGQGFITQSENPVSQNNGKELDDIKEDLPILKRNILALERSNEALREAKDEAESNLGRLKYQNEISKDQASSMCRALAEKEMTIKDQQAEIDNLARKLADSETKLKELGNIAAEHDHLRDTIKKLTDERDEAVQASAGAKHDETHSQSLVEIITKQEKTILQLRQKLVEESMRNADLEDEVLDLRRLSNEVELNELKAKLREKTSECDRQRNQIKTVETHRQHLHDRLMDITKNGVALRGAVHLVKPNAQAQLPKAVIACSECYANNIECDNNVTCRSCTERGESCARWRCSLKHKLGNCPLTPCKFPHDSQGWLVLRAERPQW